MVSVICGVERCEDLCTGEPLQTGFLKFVSSKLLHSIPKCLSTDSAKSSVLSAFVWWFYHPVSLQDTVAFWVVRKFLILHHDFVRSFSRLTRTLLILL